MSMREKLELLQQKRSESEQGGGQERIATQHQKGKMTARERLDVLLDPGSFVELDRFVTHRATDFGLDEQKVLGDGVPPKTVKSCEKTYTRRPSMRPYPVTTPSP